MVAISTRFAHALSPSEAIDRSLDAGALVLDRNIDPAWLEPLVAALDGRRDELPVLAIESPCPRGRAATAQLASIDREEARTALDAATETLRLAGKLGARFLALQLGEVRTMERDWIFARDRFVRGALDEPTARGLMARRAREGARPLDGARRAVDRLSRIAESEGVTLAIANGRRFTALPDARELDTLLAELRGAPLAPLFDVVAAHLPDAMGLAPFALTQAAFGRAPLVYLGDACGPIGALAPGRGELDVSAIARGLDGAAAIAFSPWAGLTVEEALFAREVTARIWRSRAAPPA
jgi:sugar phosphate isomerase/epimerase